MKVKMDQGDFVVKVNSSGKVTVYTGVLTLELEGTSIDKTVTGLMEEVSKLIAGSKMVEDQNV